MLELAILGLLKEQPMHGYELRKQLSQKLGFFWTVSFGSLYPTLKRLEQREVVEMHAYGDKPSRKRQVYAITERGEREFLELLAESAVTTWEEDKFPLRLAFFRYLKPEMRIRLLERRKVYLEDKLDFGRASLRRTLDRTKSADSYTVSLMRHGLDTTERDIAWLDELIATERHFLASADEQPAPPSADVTGDGGPDSPDTPDDTPTPSEELQSQ